MIFNNRLFIIYLYLITLSAFISLTGCFNAGNSISQESASETVRLNKWFADRYEEGLNRSPISLTEIGRKDLYDQIDDYSEAAKEDYLQWRANTVDDLKANFDYSALTTDAKISYDLWVYRYESSLAMAPFRRHFYIFTQMDGGHSSLPNFLINKHKVEDIEDMQAYIKRVTGISVAIFQLLERAQIAAEAGVRPPQFAYEGAISVSKKLIEGAPFDRTSNVDSPLWSDVQAKIATLLKDKKITSTQASSLRLSAQQTLLEKFQPAYMTLIEWLASDRENADKVARGVSALPDGDKFYKARLLDNTNTDLSAEEIHNIGLSEVTRLRGEMEIIKQQVQFNGTLQDFFTFIKTDKQFLYPNTDEGRQDYLDDATAYLDSIRNKLPEFFRILPKAELVVKRVESFRESDGAPQHYSAPTKDGSRPGIYYAHLSDMSSMPKNEMEAIAYHEGIPGHHLQISIARELEGIPEFRTHGGSVSFVEGWALYAEFLAKEMGAYLDPFTDFGRLMTEMWRAVRLVVDTGIHAKGWSEEQAVNYFKENIPMAEGQIKAEVRRYFVWPGQATGYKIGMLKILALREKARSALGDKFDIREYHDIVLGGGFVPLSILERRVDNWIRGMQMPLN
ncbi:MAG: hypothetical protein ACI9XC_001815 [Gammaproteobacteria bacterium]|jgi:uncharacterized protein (DUF885 family)